ncbi:unnamed protein product [Protopolystoma xenopodis]|uniref:Uncharacterized protein n=1 Tax=Protopolystoma xenopodis TaxID=117903 RepID=A0A3S5BFM1_9PLAT|nr:unnamed protein product [Protopolystoma xenopodis]
MATPNVLFCTQLDFIFTCSFLRLKDLYQIPQTTRNPARESASTVSVEENHTISKLLPATYHRPSAVTVSNHISNLNGKEHRKRIEATVQHPQKQRFASPSNLIPIRELSNAESPRVKIRSGLNISSNAQSHNRENSNAIVHNYVRSRYRMGSKASVNSSTAPIETMPSTMPNISSDSGCWPDGNLSFHPNHTTHSDHVISTSITVPVSSQSAVIGPRVRRLPGQSTKSTKHGALRIMAEQTGNVNENVRVQYGSASVSHDENMRIVNSGHPKITRLKHIRQVRRVHLIKLQDSKDTYIQEAKVCRYDIACMTFGVNWYSGVVPVIA